MLNSDFQLPYDNGVVRQGLSAYFKSPVKNNNDGIKILSQIPDTNLSDNRIVTHKYNAINFIPLNLKDQFSKLANCYFLLIGLLQMIPEISISEGKPVIYMPLLVVLTVSALKDLFEDLKKNRQDREENTAIVNKMNQNGNFSKIQCEQLRVGDIVIVKDNEQFPADLIILNSSHAKGDCFIETKNLDGETNLKRKLVPKQLLRNDIMQHIQKERFIEAKFELPNPYIYKFNGYIKPDFGDQQQLEKISLNENNFVLRGCNLKHTDYMIGLVTFTGHDTKIMQNTVKQRPKHSSVEKMMNVCIVVIFIIQIVSTLITALISLFWKQYHEGLLPYLGDDEMSQAEYTFVKWGTWIMIYTNFVPISLIVSLEFVKFIQGMLINEDPKTYSYRYDIPANVQCSSLNEELGQVEYIFSDKTGTLTSNIMSFKNLVVRGIGFGKINSINQQQLKEQNYPQVTNVEFYDKEFLDLAKQDNQSQQNNQYFQNIKEVLLHLALCHDIVTQRDKNNNITYNASSPDELALVNFARLTGYEFQGVDQNDIICIQNIYTKEKFLYQSLYNLEFNSARKRMSVIVKDLQNQEIMLLTKGSDSTIQRISSQQSQQSQIAKQTQNLVNQYADVGLRTLLLAKRIIPENEFQEWKQKYSQAMLSLQNRDQKMEDLQSEIEVEMEIIGATAIEDMLQDQVGETIAQIIKTGIKFWVLTGDKVETAINICHSCQLLNPQTELLMIEGQTDEIIVQKLNEFSNKIEIQKQQDTTVPNQAIVITGLALYQIYKNDKLIDQFMSICKHSRSVVACQVSPKQKQEIVTMVRKADPTKTTLSIGDGANDVNMITASHVGIGIQGVEGKQAARASDYSVGEFKILRNLLLYHGRECYRRNSNLIGYNFYKNLLLVIPQWAYGIYNGFSATPLYDPWLYQLYNITYTNLPVIVYAIFDQEFTQNLLINQPSLYIQGMKSQLFNKKEFLKWLLIGFWQSVVIGILTFIFVESNASNSFGYMGFFASTGMACYWLSIVQANLRILQISNTHSIGSIITVIGSILTYIISYAIFSNKFVSEDIYNTFTNLFFNDIIFWYITLVMLGITFGGDYFLYIVHYYKNKVQSVQLFQKFTQNTLSNIQNNIQRKENNKNNDQEIELQGF